MITQRHFKSKINVPQITHKYYSCFSFDMRELNIAFSDHDRTAVNRFSRITVRGVKKIREHEAFDAYTYNNDIAVLELDEPVDFGSSIQPICLPEAGTFL